MVSERPPEAGLVALSPAEPAPSGTVTFLFTDIEGSTRLLERLRGLYADLLVEHRRILRASFAEWRGHEVDTQGDSFFVAFARASDALSCAVEGQRALSASKWPDDVDVRVRMGIHTGEPLVAGSDYVGMDVHRAARIASAGHGGQILVSGTTHDLVADDLPAGVTLTDLGSHRLKDLRRDTRLYQVGGEGLRDKFEPLVTTSADEQPPTPGEPPYRGLQAFEASDADLFFGREEIVGELVERVIGARFLALIGASGSGKSSILRAGLIPTLRQRAGIHRVVLLTPTAHPLEELASAIEPDAPASRIAALVDELRAEPRTLMVELRRASRRGGRTVIAVDQLEEVFTLCRDEVERQAFLAALVHACAVNEGAANTPADADRASLVITLRADFYAYLAPYPEVRAAAAASQMYVGAMSAEELRRAIEEPARRGGWEFVPGLVDLLLRDVGDEPGALPLLSHALLETWQRRRGVTMNLRSYSESGGVKGAIARTADRVYETELSEPQRRMARDIFVRLTELGEGAQDTRRRARLDELMPSNDARAAEVRLVIGALADARLVTVGEETLEVAHEALIREWPTLREWLSTDRDSLRVHRRLTEAATEWEVSGRDESALFRGARLAQARESTEYKGGLNPLEQQFLDASLALEEREGSEREAARQREIDAAQALAAVESRRAEESVRSASGLRRRAFLLAGALVAAAVLAGVTFVFAQQSAANASLADQRAQEARDNAALAEQRAAEASDSAALAQQREQDARDSEARAQAQSTRAQAQRLGSDATQVLLNGRDPELAALLALNGLQVGYTPEADAALQRAGRRLDGAVFQHDGPVESMVMTPDGKTMITQSERTIRIWDVESGALTQTLPAPAGSTANGSYSYLEMSSDGHILLASGYDGAGALYRLSGQPTTAEQIALGCPSIVAYAGIRAISGDGRVVATYLTGDTAGAVVVVTVEDCSPVGEPFRLGVGVNDPTLNQDGSRFIASILDDALTVWDVVKGQEVRTFGTDVGQFWHSAFSPDGSQIAVGGFDGTVHVYDAQTGDLIQTYRGHASGVEHAVLSADNSRLLTSSQDGTARLWDTATATELRRFVHGAAVRQSVLSANGDDVFTASEDGTVRGWSATPTGEAFTFQGSDGEVTGLSFSPDGQRLATAGGDNVRIFGLASGNRDVDMDRRASTLVAFAPGGDAVLSVSSFGSALLDAQTGAEIREFSGSARSGQAMSASFSADGRLVLGSDVQITSQVLYEAATGAALLPFQLETAVLSADGSKVAGWSPGRYSIYDAVTGDVLQSFGLDGVDSRAVDVAFSPDGSRIVTGDHDNVVRVRDMATRKVLLEMPGHSSPIRQVRVSADGAYALTASDDGGARLWSLASGDLLRLFPGHGGRAVTSIAISPDGKAVAVGSADGSVIISSVSLDDLVADVCSVLTRDLTQEERLAYNIQDQSPTCP